LKSFSVLKALRVLLAIVLCTPVLLLFIDFADVLPNSFSKILQRQLMPAVFTGAVATLFIYFVLTLLFGRIYCSTICPTGILLDVLNRMACIGKKKKNGKLRFRYHKPMNLLRYALLGVTVALALFGVTELCLLLDPYSNFGRIATNIFRPAIIWINNVIAGILSARGNYALYNITITIPAAALIAAATIFVVFAVMVYFRGRLFCNTLCPVGALLSLVSRYSLFRISIDKNACNRCSLCERTCKAEAINSRNKRVDASRCVACFNCTSSCNSDALQFRFVRPVIFKRNGAAPIHAAFSVNGEPPAGIMALEEKTNHIQESRRSFLSTGVTIAGIAPTLILAKTAPILAITDSPSDSTPANNNKPTSNNQPPITPPGSLSIERFKKLCTGCHICVVHCPTRLLKPAGLEYGFSYLLKPYVSYEKNYCNYSCTICSEVCPTDAMKPITIEEKKVTQVGIAHFDTDLCIVHTDENDCGACSEHCPTQAVHMIPYKGALTIPKVEPELCIGCGGCESICPVRPHRAIFIIPNATHQFIEKPEEEETKEIEIDDFGF
jgi:ferredoxin